jgi:phosphatidylglycerophosphatase A
MASSGAAGTLATLTATWFGCGYSKIAPGTVGSLAAVLLAMLLNVGGATGALIGFAGCILVLPAIWSAGSVARATGMKDPGIIVVDEVVGQCIAFAGARTTLNWKSWFLGFLLFRLFDIVKPPPVRQLEALPGGLGIVADDAMAGVYAALVLYWLGWCNFY